MTIFKEYQLVQKPEFEKLKTKKYCGGPSEKAGI
jgi:hypothetical protein